GKAMSKEDVMADMVSEVTAETPSLIAAYDLTKIQKDGGILVIPDLKGNHPAELHGYDHIYTNSSVHLNQNSTSLRCHINAYGKLVVRTQSAVLSESSIIQIYNSLGQLITTETLIGQETELSSTLMSGLYIVKCLNQTAKVLVK
ncbi:MAG: T9SS type A sorting domain-containing protein, partial [Pigmentiphaga sp.]|nr:T9SS type A sorting domain-containing protein [Pigmentiphaga sp.]